MTICHNWSGCDGLTDELDGFLQLLFALKRNSYSNLLRLFRASFNFNPSAELPPSRQNLYFIKPPLLCIPRFRNLANMREDKADNREGDLTR